LLFSTSLSNLWLPPLVILFGFPFPQSVQGKTRLPGSPFLFASLPSLPNPQGRPLLTNGQRLYLSSLLPPQERERPRGKSREKRERAKKEKVFLSLSGISFHFSLSTHYFATERGGLPRPRNASLFRGRLHCRSPRHSSLLLSLSLSPFAIQSFSERTR